MTNDSHGAPRGYGPFHQDPDTTASLTPGSEREPEPGNTPTTGSGPARDPAAASVGVPQPEPGVTPTSVSGVPEQYTPTSGVPNQYGSDAYPTSGGPNQYGSVPTSGAPNRYGAVAPPGQDGFHPAPTSAGPDRYGLDPTPTSGASGQYGVNAAPVSGGPDRYGLGPAPVSGGTDRYGLGPAPVSGGTDQYGLDPAPPRFGFDAGPDRFGGDAAPRPGPRIEPSPPKQRNPLVMGIAAGLAAGLILFGGGGFFAGRATGGPSAAPTPGPTGSAPSAGPSLGAYEQHQASINQAKLTGAVAPLSQAWLPGLSNCERNGESGGPGLGTGEKSRVRCRFDGMSVIFVEFNTVADRDKARVKTLGQNVDARTLTPGVAAAGDKRSPSGRTTGSYVEYAYTVTEDGKKRIVSGIWWDDTAAPVAAYVLAYWTDGLGESWEPIRDVWNRYA